MSDEGAALLDADERAELLRVARIALEDHLFHGRRPPGAPHRPVLLAPRPVFVSLHVAGALRGCMGRIETETPLYAAVMDLAVSAATSDPRFPPLEVAELPQARLEVSVLSPKSRVASPDEIELGRDGLVVTRGARRGLLLPKVAIDHRFTVEQFLDETCAKAGLPRDAWRDPAVTIERFEAQVFAEPD